jgi:hypothetical protein
MWKAGVIAALASFAMSQAQAQEAICTGPKTTVAQLDTDMADVGASLVAQTPLTPDGIWFLFQMPNGRFVDVWVALDGQACISQVYIGDPRNPGASA